LAIVLGWIANRIKAITGKTNWFDTPSTTLEAANTHINSDVHTVATQSKNGIMSAIDKQKLDGVASGAQKNADITKAEIEAKLTGTLTSHTHNAATQSANGLMSAADKTKLDGVATGAQKNSDITKAEIEAKLTGTIATHAHDAVTQSANGFMSAADKIKLDGATSAYTANALALRDASGRLQVQSPSATYDVVNKTYADSYYVRLATAATMLAMLTAQSNTSYTARQVRNIVFWTSGSAPTSSSGDLVVKTFE
jgi:hypothetical protein